MFNLLKLVLKDVFTSANGDYDPARLWGYGFTILGGTQFLVSFAWVTYKTQTFDAVNFAAGLVGISGSLVAAAAGVYIKRNAEVPLDTTVKVTEAPGAGDATTTTVEASSDAKPAA
jgi:hypothetical protein